MSNGRWRINWAPILVWGALVALWMLLIWKVSTNRE